jgi:type IV secretion system protein TrbL
MSCAGISAINPGCLISSGSSAVASGFMDQIGQAFATGADKAVEFLLAGWTQVPSPTVSGGAADWLQGQLQPLVLFIGALAIVAAMVRTVWASKAEPAKEMMAGLLRLVVVSAVGLAAVDVLLKAGDAFSSSILNAATPNGGNFGQLAVLGAAPAGVAAIAPVLLIILGAVVILASLLQLFLLLARAGLVVVLGGTWPLAAAASSTPAGNAWFRKTTAWLLAFVAFKPTAAIVYAAALRLMLAPNQGAIAGQGGLAIVEGVLLFGMGVLALPALMRFAVPAVSAVGGISAGKVAAGAAIVATGAIATVATGGAAAPAAAGAATGAVQSAGGGDGPLKQDAPPPKAPPAPAGATGV